MAAITVRRNVSKPLLSLQGLYHKFVEAGDAKPQPLTEDDYLSFKPGEISVSKWKKMDSRSLGITRTMVPVPPCTVMHILRTRGFEAYLVGGCVRDLLLNRIPKDFDVITTADLNQISKQFHRCEVVGLRFPICRVYIKGSVVEVSSFDTLAKDTEGKEKFLESQMPRGCDALDLVRWKNSMHRDFTINSLFFDPFLHKIYDYNDGMKDLLELKLRTLVPAQLSFTEDSARILRGLRIAARLGLSLSKEIKSAIFKQTSAIPRLGQSRITMELNSMLSFGAAESSLSLLHKYHLLEILLPFQAAYISQQATRSGQSSMMLMKLLSHLDKLVTCDRPSGSYLWIGLLGFHLALVNNPQHPFVILTFASVLYHQNWEDGLNFARKNGLRLVNFDPETIEPFELISDDEIAEKVNQLAMLVVDSIDVFVETDSLHKTMEKFSGIPYPGLVFIPKNMGHNTKQLFHVLAHKLETYKKGRASFEINYDLLRKGDFVETRFALGKIILNTMGCEVDFDHDYDNPNEVNHHSLSSPKNENHMNKKTDRNQPPFELDLQLDSAPKKQKLIAKLSSIMHQRPAQIEYKVQQDKSHARIFTKHTEVIGVSPNPKDEDHMIDKPETGASESPMQELFSLLEPVVNNEKSLIQLESQNLEERLEENTEVELDHSVVENDEIGVNSVLLSVQTNFKRVIEEARDSPAETGKLNQFLVCFVEEQVQRKKGKKHIETTSLMSSSIDTSQTEAYSSVTSIGNHQIESGQLEASIGTSLSDSKVLESSRFVASSMVTSEVESIPEYVHPQEPKATRSKRTMRVNLITNGERKKQRVCSYCKEVGHNKTGCSKRKAEEAFCRVSP